MNKVLLTNETPPIILYPGISGAIELENNIQINFSVTSGQALIFKRNGKIIIEPVEVKRPIGAEGKEG